MAGLQIPDIPTNSTHLIPDRIPIEFNCISKASALAHLCTDLDTHWAWTKFGVKKMDRELDIYSIHIHTNILSQKPKKSVGKFLSYGFFFNFVYHTIYLAHVSQHVWFINEINTSELIE